MGGSPDGRGWFFPEGVNGRIKTPDPLNPDVSLTAPRPQWQNKQALECAAMAPVSLGTGCWLCNSNEHGPVTITWCLAVSATSPHPGPCPLPALCLQVPEELLALANAPYTVVESPDDINPLKVVPPKSNATEELVSELSASSVSG